MQCCPKVCSRQYKEGGKFTFGSFKMIFGSPLKNFDFCRLSCWNKESMYCRVIHPTSSKKWI